MKTPRHIIAATLAQKSLAGTDASFVKTVAAYLLAERRTGELESIMRDIMQYRADHGIVEVIASSAHPLTAAVRATIKERVQSLNSSAKHIIITEQSDHDVVGGVRLDFANQQLDLSVRNTLNRFKQLTV